MCLLVVSVLAGACSVKEDRSGCPCALVVDLTGIGGQVRDEDYPVLLRIEGEQTDYTGWLDEEDCSGFFQFVVPDKRVRVWVVAGDEGLFDEGVEIPAGCGSPPLVWWCGEVETIGESVLCRPDLQKDYCCLTLRLKGPFGGDRNPYTLTVLGQIRGFSSPGELLAGAFYCRFPAVGPVDEETMRVCQIFLPRQEDDSLRLEVESQDGGSRLFALGEYIARAGYDWTARNLADMTVELDCALTTVTVSGGWTDQVHQEIVF